MAKCLCQTCKNKLLTGGLYGFLKWLAKNKWSRKWQETLVMNAFSKVVWELVQLQYVNVKETEISTWWKIKNK